MKYIRTYIKSLAGSFIGLAMLLFFQNNAVAQAHVSDKNYDMLLSTLLVHDVPEVEVNDAKTEENVIWLDAREKAEYNVSHIRGAIWVGYDDFSRQRIAALDKNATYIVYCSVGYRSEQITDSLMQAGFIHVQNLYGGIFEWVNTGNPVVDTNGMQTNKVHAYSKSWGIWLKRGEKVYDN
ncbi:MAG: rhodanese-like domain-containing protein [Chitinophagales bacterium]